MADSYGFEVGDRVRYIGKKSIHILEDGELLTVVETQDRQSADLGVWWIGVQTDKPHGLHNCNGCAEDGCGWYLFREDDSIPIEREESEIAAPDLSTLYERGC